MLEAEMTEMVEALVGDERYKNLIGPYITMAKSAVVNHLFPYKPDALWVDVPEKYHVQTCEIACYLINRRGAEGETQHIESGVSRTYEKATIPSGFFAGMPPFVGVPESCETLIETDD